MRVGGDYNRSDARGHYRGLVRPRGGSSGTGADIERAPGPSHGLESPSMLGTISKKVKLLGLGFR